MEIDNGFYRGYVTKAKTLSAEFEKNLRKNYPKLNIDWIITGDGPMVLQPEGGNQTVCTPQTDRPEEFLLLLPALASAGILQGDGQAVRVEDCERFFIPSLAHSGAEFLIKVKGDSMYPLYPNGCLLAIRRVQSAQTMNNYLKKIAELMGIDAPVYHAYYQGNKRYEETVPKYQVLSTHAGRRTFVVTAITLGMDLSVIMKFTGHSPLSAMKPYMDIVDELKQKEMNKFNEF